MFERFTDRARKVMALANQEAKRFNREFLGTEHLLLGLVREGSGVAAATLKNMGVDIRKIRLEVEKAVKSGPELVTMGKLPQTPRVKKSIEFAIEEAKSLGHSYVGTEHQLLGLLREGDGIAAAVLKSLGLETEKVRAAVLELLGTQPKLSPASGIMVRKREVYDLAINGFEHVGFELVSHIGGRLEFRRGEQVVVLDQSMQLVSSSIPSAWLPAA